MAEDVPEIEMRVVGDFSEFDREVARRESQNYQARFAGTFASPVVGGGFPALPAPDVFRALPAPGEGTVPVWGGAPLQPVPNRSPAAMGGPGGGRGAEALDASASRAAAALEHLSRVIEGTVAKQGQRQLDPGQTGIVMSRLPGPGGAGGGPNWRFSDPEHVRSIFDRMYNAGMFQRPPILAGGPVYPEGPGWENMLRPPPQLPYQGQPNLADAGRPLLPSPPGVGPSWAQSTLLPRTVRPPMGGGGGGGGGAPPVMGGFGGFGAWNLARAAVGIKGGQLGGWLGRQMGKEVMPNMMFYNAMFGAWEASMMAAEVEEADTARQIAVNTPQALKGTADSMTSGARGILSGIAFLPVWGFDVAAGTDFSPIRTAQTLKRQAARYESLDRVQTSLQTADTMKIVSQAALSGSEDTLKNAMIRTQAYTDLMPNRKRQRELSERLEATVLDAPSIFEFYNPAGDRFFENQSNLRTQYEITDPGIRSAFNQELMGLKREEEQRKRQMNIELQRSWRERELQRDTARTFITGQAERARGATGTLREQMETDITWSTTEALAQVRDPTLVEPLRKALDLSAKGRRENFEIETRNLQTQLSNESVMIRMRGQGAGVRDMEAASRRIRHEKEMEEAERLRPELIPHLANAQATENEMADALWRRQQARRRESITSSAMTSARSMARSNAAMEFFLNRQPFQGQMAQIQAETDDQLEMAGLIPLGNVRRIVQGQIERRGEQRKTAARMAYDDESFLLDMAIGTERVSLARRRQRDVVGAMSAEISGEGGAQVFQLMQQGRAIQAMNTADNVVSRLELNRQQYLESFRATEINLSQITTSNPRDTANPSAVLQGIRTDIAEFKAYVGSLIDGG